MATSGSYNFTQTRDEIIQDALELIGVYGVGTTISSEDMNYCARALNKMIKFWSTKGLHLWSKEEGVLFFTPSTGEYSLGDSASNAHVTNVNDLVITQLNGAASSGAATITVDSTTGMASGDNVGVVLSDNTIHWTTINGAPTSTVITLTSVLTGAASDNGLVYTYTSRIYKPLRLLSARIRSGISTSINDRPIELVSYSDYFDLVNKVTSSSPVQAHYNPKLDSGKIYLWPCPSDGSERLHFTYERILEDLDEASNNFDLPNEWLEPITWQLALRVARAFGKGDTIMQIAPIASTMLDDLMAWDRETVALEFYPGAD